MDSSIRRFNPCTDFSAHGKCTDVILCYYLPFVSVGIHNSDATAIFDFDFDNVLHVFKRLYFFILFVFGLVKL